MKENYPENLISSIAESIDCGMICFLNTETFEMEEVPQFMLEDPDRFEEDAEFEPLKHSTWEHCIRIEPLESNESFRIMEDFTDWMPDHHLKHQLLEALRHKRPFANFKMMIDDSKYRQDWFDFKQNYLKDYVQDLIDLELGNEPELDFEEINGFFDDDGNKIDPDSVPVHSLCVICKSHHTDDWEENLLCLMNRYDQRNESDFKCGAFEKM